MESFIEHWKNRSNGKIISKEIDLHSLQLTLTFIKDKHKQKYSFDQSKLEQALKAAEVIDDNDKVAFTMLSADDFLQQLEQFANQSGAYSKKFGTAADVQISFCSFVGAPTIQTNFKQNIDTLAANYHFAELDFSKSKVKFLYNIAWDCFLVALSKDGRIARVVVATDTD